MPYYVQDPAKFKLVSEAYSVLSSASKRAAHDEDLEARVEELRRRNEGYAASSGGRGGWAATGAAHGEAAYRGGMAAHRERMRVDSYHRGRIMRYVAN